MAALSLSAIATYATLASAAASIAAIGYQAAQGTPKSPDLASSSREVAMAKARMLPIQRALAFAEQTGGSYGMDIAAHKEKKPFVRVPAGWKTGLGMSEPGVGDIWGFIGSGDTYKYVPYVKEEWEEGGKYFKEGQSVPGAQGGFKIVQRNTRVPAHHEDYDFAGYGTADIEGELARKYADIQTDLGSKYGTKFAEEARREAEQADPLGFAARAKEAELINNEAKNPQPINPLSPVLDQQIDAQLKAGSGLDADSRALLDSALARAAGERGGGPTAEDVATSMSTGVEGAARRQAGISKAQGWLGSGKTPEDLEYQREQQLLADMGAFTSGRTPQSQFGDLSRAGQGAAPFVAGQPLPNQPNNAGAGGAPYSVAAWQAGLRSQHGQANPWLAGISTLLSGVNAYAGTQPTG